MKNLIWLLGCLLLIGCAETEFASCTPERHADLSRAAEFAANDSLPFRFPLDEVVPGEDEEHAVFCSSGRKKLGAPYSYHAAEDYHRPAGTPVYAMAEGKVSFSGPMGGLNR